VVTCVWFGVNRALSPLSAIRVVADSSVAAPTEGCSTSLRIVAFNIAHGRGEHRPLWDRGDRSEVAARVRRIGRLLHELAPDIVVLNEVDFASFRSANVDQAAILADASGLPYRCEQRNVDMAVPFLQNRYGNLVLSRFEILSASRVPLPGHTWWETLLVGKKDGLLCTLPLREEGMVSVFAVHFDHRAEELRLRSAAAMVAARASRPGPFIAAGDFNSTLATAAAPEATVDGQTAVTWLVREHGLRTLPWPEVRDQDLTSPAHDPARAIDWVVVSEDFEIAERIVLPVQLSDHLPVLVELRLRGGDERTVARSSDDGSAAVTDAR
jgi:endonuclease/exonuclease/phosphatase family metal-dependent hydrolase